jgi:hypothetical protein
MIDRFSESIVDDALLSWLKPFSHTVERSSNITAGEPADAHRAEPAL